jgi:hypothetical protein
VSLQEVHSSVVVVSEHGQLRSAGPIQRWTRARELIGFMSASDVDGTVSRRGLATMRGANRWDGIGGSWQEFFLAKLPMPATQLALVWSTWSRSETGAANALDLALAENIIRAGQAA